MSEREDHEKWLEHNCLNMDCDEFGRATCKCAHILATAHAAGREAGMREAVEVMRTVDAMIFNDNGDVTWSPLQIRSAIRAFLAAQEDSTSE